MVLVCSQFLSVLLVGSHCPHRFSVFISGSRRFAVVLVGSRWFSMFLRCSRRFS